MPTLEPGSLAVVTGASGFVGANVVRSLLERGVRVRALVRSTSPRLGLAGLPIERVVGDLRDPASLRRALRGARWLFHVAADYRIWVPDEAAMIASNVLGTRGVLAAAGRAGVERVVYTSSVATVAIPDDGRTGAESDWLAPEQAIGAYKRSKILAEREALAAAKRGLPVVIVNPSAPFGPWDVKPTETGRVVLDFLRGGLAARFFVDTGLNVVDVRDCAEGHCAAAERGTVGERYILGGENLTYLQILTKVAEATGREPPGIRVPGFVVGLMGFLGENIKGRLLRRTPRVTRDAARMAGKRMWFDPGRAKRELGVESRPAGEALAAAADWFVAHGYTKDRAQRSAPSAQRGA